MASPTLLTASLPAKWADGRTRSLGSVFKETLSVLDKVPEAQFAAIIGFSATTDASSDFQNAIDEHIYKDSYVGETLVPRGLYPTSKTLHLGYGIGFTAGRLRGPGYCYTGTHSFNGPVVKPSFSDSPALNIQGARGSSVRGLAFLGLNSAFITNGALGNLTAPATDDTLGANWVDPTLNANADTRYAPYAAIVIDGYAGTRPATSYPDVTYPSAYVGAGITQYGKGASSDVLIEDVYIDGFVVAVAVQPSDADANADFTCLRRVTIQNCRYGVSVGNTQSRNVRLSDVKFNAVHTGLTSRVHGRQNGRFGGVVDNCSFGKTVQVFDFHTISIVGPLTFNNLYAESTWRLGDFIPSTASENSLIFNNPQLDLGDQSTARGIPAKVLGTGSQPVVVMFNGGRVAGYQNVCNLDVSSRDLHLAGTSFAPGNTPTQLYQKAAEHATCGGLILNQLGKAVGSRAPFRAKWGGWNIDTAASAGALLAGPNYPSKRALPTPIYMREHYPALGTPDDTFPVPERVVAISKASVTTTLVNDLLTMTFGSRTDTAFMFYGPLPGDLIWDDQTGTVFKVASRSGLVVTAYIQNNYKGASFTPITSISMTVGNWYVANSRLYLCDTPCLYDATAGSAVLTNVGSADGTSAFLDTNLVVGDYLWVDPLRDAWISQANARITAFDSTAKTITLAGNVASGFTATRKRLGTLIRLPVANYP
jgi:hypothetical protein